MGIYVERLIPADRERLWTLTQAPDFHERWDLRFSRIRYQPKPQPGEPQAFAYAKRIVPGVVIRGTGVTVGSKAADNGESSSALRFFSEDRRSLIREGSGYWRYVPEAEGVRFITGYDYRVRWGWLGRAVDALFFRRAAAWATAWSFDRLGRWATTGVAPETSMRIAVAYTVARATAAGIWFYQGLFPKLLGPHREEVRMTAALGIAHPAAFVRGMGVVEIAMGVVLLLLWRRRWPVVVSALAMIPALVMGMKAAPELIAAPFNVVTLNAATAALSVIACLLLPDVVTASACRWSARGNPKGPTGARP
ncbi:MAG TPA: DoxX-like family protein [Phycisphaerae bacterium]|nr:DoxX-like family protein [Phycisphaerae bacterium]